MGYIHGHFPPYLSQLNCHPHSLSRVPCLPFYSTSIFKLTSSLVVFHFALWSLSDFQYLRVKPKSLSRVSAVTLPPLLIFHLSSIPLKHTLVGALHGLSHSTFVPSLGSTGPLQGSGQLSRPWGRTTWQPCRQLFRIQPRGVTQRC